MKWDAKLGTASGRLRFVGSGGGAEERLGELAVGNEKRRAQGKGKKKKKTPALTGAAEFQGMLIGA